MNMQFLFYKYGTVYLFDGMCICVFRTQEQRGKNKGEDDEVKICISGDVVIGWDGMGGEEG